jgi:hypothetical protein
MYSKSVEACLEAVGLHSETIKHDHDEVQGKTHTNSVIFLCSAVPTEAVMLK